MIDQSVFQNRKTLPLGGLDAVAAGEGFIWRFV